MQTYYQHKSYINCKYPLLNCIGAMGQCTVYNTRQIFTTFTDIFLNLLDGSATWRFLLSFHQHSHTVNYYLSSLLFTVHSSIYWLLLMLGWKLCDCSHPHRPSPHMDAGGRLINQLEARQDTASASDWFLWRSPGGTGWLRWVAVWKLEFTQGK